MHITYIKLLMMVLLLVIILPVGCSQQTELNFDHESWRTDRMGCEGDRVRIYSDLIAHKKDLLGLNSKKIARLLGHPDRNELYRRNQKFFIYHISPAGNCKPADYEGDPLFLVIRFNAMGLSSEIYLNDTVSPVREPI